MPHIATLHIEGVVHSHCETDRIAGHGRRANGNAECQLSAGRYRRAGQALVVSTEAGRRGEHHIELVDGVGRCVVEIALIQPAAVGRTNHFLFREITTGRETGQHHCVAADHRISLHPLDFQQWIGKLRRVDAQHGQVGGAQWQRAPQWRYHIEHDDGGAVTDGGPTGTERVGKGAESSAGRDEAEAHAVKVIA